MFLRQPPANFRFAPRLYPVPLSEKVGQKVGPAAVIGDRRAAIRTVGPVTVIRDQPHEEKGPRDPEDAVQVDTPAAVVENS